MYPSAAPVLGILSLVVVFTGDGDGVSTTGTVGLIDGDVGTLTGELEGFVVGHTVAFVLVASSPVGVVVGVCVLTPPPTETLVVISLIFIGSCNAAFHPQLIQVL